MPPALPTEHSGFAKIFTSLGTDGFTVIKKKIENEFILQHQILCTENPVFLLHFVLHSSFAETCSVYADILKFIC